MKKVLKFLGIIGILFMLAGCSKEYTVKFDSSGGTKVKNQVIEKNKKVAKPIDPTKKGYDFDGWYLNGKLYYFNTPITKNITLKAKWTEASEEKYTITFDSNGGSEIKSIKVIEGKIPTKPDDPVKEGYVFNGWLLNNNPYNFDTKIVSDINLVASWTESTSSDGKVKYNVSFNSNGGSSVERQTIEKDGIAKKPNNPTKNGYNFDCWLLNGKSYNFNTKVTSNITLVASYTVVQTTNPTPKVEPEIVKYNVSFNSNGGSSVATQVITAGGKATIPSNPTRSGYRFINWTLNGGAYDFSRTINDNIVLSANWELIPIPDVYTVSLELINGESGIPERKAIVKKNGSVITVQQIQNQNGDVLGNHVSALGAVRVNKAQYDLATSLKVKLSDGTVVSANKI